MIINVLYIAIICVLVTDVLHFWENFSPYITKWLSGGRFKQAIDFKLFTCSTCQTWWVSLIYIIISGLLSLQNIVIILVIACSTPILHSVWHVASDNIIKLLNYLNR